MMVMMMMIRIVKHCAGLMTVEGMGSNSRTTFDDGDGDDDDPHRLTLCQWGDMGKLHQSDKLLLPLHQ